MCEALSDVELNEFQVCVHEGYHAFSLAVYNITTSIMYSYVPSDAEILILSVLQVRCFSAPLQPTDFFFEGSLLKFQESRELFRRRCQKCK